MAKILSVDDEPSIVRLVTATLTARGHTVAGAHSGAEALALVKTEKPDLIVLDIMMPGMDGREVYRRLAADPATKGIPVLFLSAIGEFASQIDTVEMGDAEYMTKPFTPKDLAEQVATMLDPATAEERASRRHAQLSKLRMMVTIMHREHD